jgi:hypothetical protein
MTMNDLTAPLGQNPRRHRRAIAVPAEIIAMALGLFFGAFVLWAVTAANDPRMARFLRPQRYSTDDRVGQN